jgi:tyrosine phenol-lyase
MRTVAEGIIQVWKRRDSIGGLAFVYEPPHLRFFRGRFAPAEEVGAKVEVASAAL